MGQKISAQQVKARVHVPCSMGQLDTIQLTYRKDSCWGRRSKVIASFTFPSDGWEPLGEVALGNRSANSATVRLARLEKKDPRTSVKVWCQAGGSTVLKARLPLGDLLVDLRGSDEGNTSTLNFTVLSSRPEWGEAASHCRDPEGCREGQQQQPFLFLWCNGHKCSNETHGNQNEASWVQSELHSEDQQKDVPRARSEADDAELLSPGHCQDVRDQQGQLPDQTPLDAPGISGKDDCLTTNRSAAEACEEESQNDDAVLRPDNLAHPMHEGLPQGTKDSPKQDDDEEERALEEKARLGLKKIEEIVQQSIRNLEDQRRTYMIKNSLDKLNKEKLSEGSSSSSPVWRELMGADYLFEEEEEAREDAGAERDGLLQRLAYYAGWLAMGVMCYNAWLEFTRE